jgi:hypothetical protein
MGFYPIENGKYMVLHKKCKRKPYIIAKKPFLSQKSFFSKGLLLNSIDLALMQAKKHFDDKW